MSKITDVQKDFLNKFKCIRISNDVKYKELVLSFKCKKNPNIINYLKEHGYEEDCSGITAHYLIIYENKPVLYFALKAGSLYLPLERDLQQIGQKIKTIVKNNFKVSEHNALSYFLINPVKYYSSHPELIELFNSYKKLNLEINQEQGTIQPVTETYAGVELVNFCADDNSKAMWEKTKFVRPMGQQCFGTKYFPLFFL